jgi:putative flavoprotein involved in K+ transport
MGNEQFDVIVIGGGQAGLATGYHLAKRGLEFVIIEGGARIGDPWRKRWDSLRLFTPAQHDGLPGMAFPAEPGYYPTKDEMAGYLEAYAERLNLPVRLSTAVDGLERDGGRYVVTAGEQQMEAANVVVATGAYQTPRVPGFAPELDPAIVQVHAGAYRNPAQLQVGPVLVVGAGNSGAEIALETAAAGHPTLLSGRHPGHVPSFVYRGGGHAFWWFASRVLSVDTPIGRRVRRRALIHGGPLIRVEPKDITAAGIERVPRVAGTCAGQPQLEEDGRVLDIANVVWSTGFAYDFSWIRIPVAADDGLPTHQRGVVPSEPGLYFVGLPFLHSLTSALVGGVGRDAEYVAEHIMSRSQQRGPVRLALSSS